MIRHHDASAPSSTARRASRRVHPLDDDGPFHASRIHGDRPSTPSTARARADVGIRHRSPWQHDVGELHEPAVAKKSASHRGRDSSCGRRQHLTVARAEAPSPFRKSRSRSPATGVSMVTTSAETPALRAFDRRSARRRDRRPDTADTTPVRLSAPLPPRAAARKASRACSSSRFARRAAREVFAAWIEHAAAADRARRRAARATRPAPWCADRRRVATAERGRKGTSRTPGSSREA